MENLTRAARKEIHSPAALNSFNKSASLFTSRYNLLTHGSKESDESMWIAAILA